MRKIFLFITVLAFGLVLSGCDLIPQDVQDQIQEEVCIEDPDNPICALDSLADLEQEVVINLVDEIMLKAKEEADGTICSDFIAPGSTDLLDECSTNDFFFLPDVVNEFTALSVIADGTLYTITGMTDDATQELTLTIKVVLIEGAYFLESYSYVLNTLESGELTYDLVKLFVMDFVRDIQDSSTTTEEFCAMYYDGIDNDCDGIRDEVLESGQVLEVLYLDPDDDGDGIYDATLRVTLEDQTYEVIVEFEVFRQEFGPVKATRVDGKSSENDCNDELVECEIQFNEELAKELFMMFAADYFDETNTADYINEKYFRMMAPDGFLDNREYDLVNMTSVTVLDAVQTDNSLFDIRIELINEDGTFEEIITIELFMDEMGYYMMFVDGEDNDCDGIDEDCDYLMDPEEVAMYFEQFAMDYYNPEYTSEELNEMYFMGMNIEFFEYREEALLSTPVFTVLEARHMYDGIFEVDLEIQYEGEAMIETLEIRVNRIDMALYLEIIEEECYDCYNQLPYEEATDIIAIYVNRYNETTVLSSEVCPLMVTEYQLDQCIYERDEMISNQYEISNFLLEDIYGYYEVVITYTSPVDSYDVRYNVYFEMSEEGYLLDLYEVMDPYQYSVYNKLYYYYEQLLDPTVTLDEVCSTVTPDSIEECTELKTFLLENQVEFYLYTVDEFEDGTMMVQFMIDGLINQDSVFITYYVGLQDGGVYNPLFVHHGTDGVNPLFDQQ